MDFKLWLETSFAGLHQSAVNAFPNTQRRQHVTGTVQINDVRATPYLGVRTLLVRCEADNRAGGGGVYRPVIMFRNVVYHQGPGPGIVEIVAADNGQTVYATPPTRTGNDVLLRCNCNDEFWRFRHYNWEDGSLQGPNRNPYVATGAGDPANPTQSPGMCKHLMRMYETLAQMGMVSLI